MRHSTSFVFLFLQSCLISAVVSPSADGAEGKRFDIALHGAVADGTTVNTKSIQSAIDQCAAEGGGTLVVPKGVFVTGSIILKPKVNVEVLEGGVLKGSTDAADYPMATRRIAGAVEPHRLAMINAEKCDGLRITGPGTLDGNNPALFEQAAAAKFRADPIQYKFPQLCFIKDSSNVTVSGVKFERSAFWNLHFYRCQEILVEKSSFRVDHRTRSPSSDGVDLDSCKKARIQGCLFDVEDDCIALKGTRGPDAHADRDSPPTENIHVSDCTFIRGHGGVSLGTEATIVRNVTIENCKATLDRRAGMLRFKVRTDTPGQLYENIRMSNIEMVNSPGLIVMTRLNHGTKQVVNEPHRVIRNLTIENVTGTCEQFGVLLGNEMTDVTDVNFKNIDVKVKTPGSGISSDVKNLKMENVRVNGEPLAQ
jgi:polygalacturonase